MRSLLIVSCLALPLAACQTTAQKVCQGERGLTPGSAAFAQCEELEYSKLRQRILRHQNIGSK